jgi:hypothetical protein
VVLTFCCPKIAIYDTLISKTNVEKKLVKKASKPSPFFSSLHTAAYWVEWTLNKPSLKGKDRSPLKYVNCGVCISLEKKSLSTQGKFGFPFSSWKNFVQPTKFLTPKITKMLLCRQFGRRHPLAIGL